MKKIKAMNLVFVGIVLVIFFFFLAYVPPKLVERTSTSEFCNSCHVMNEQYESWFMTGLHRSIQCVDCHLPNDNPVNHLVWRGLDGMEDVILFYGRMFSENIVTTNHGIKTIKKNCVRCHDEMVSRITVEDRNCWDCHRRVNHKFVGLNL